jgi:hypothetical protein
VDRELLSCAETIRKCKTVDYMLDDLPVLEVNKVPTIVSSGQPGWVVYESPAPNPCCPPGKLMVALNVDFPCKSWILDRVRKLFNLAEHARIDVNIWCIEGTVGFHKDISRTASLNIPLVNGDKAITVFEGDEDYIGYRMREDRCYLLNSNRYSHAILFDKAFCKRWFLSVHFYDTPWGHLHPMLPLGDSE